MPESFDDPFEVLGVPRNASPQEIRRQYKRLAVEHHPDRNSAPEAVETFKKVTAAYAILNDPLARRRWQEDYAYHTSVGPGGTNSDSLGQRRAATRPRPLTPDEKRRQVEFAQAFAEAMVRGEWSAAEGHAGTPWRLILAGTALSAYAIPSYFNKGIPLGGNDHADLGPIPYVFWFGTACGLLLIFKPDIADEALATFLPLPVLQTLGWCILLLAPLATALMASL